MQGVSSRHLVRGKGKAYIGVDFLETLDKFKHDNFVGEQCLLIYYDCNMLQINLLLNK